MLAAAGAGALHLILPITLVIIALLAILVFSYRQVIDAYPGGGGAYAVSRAQSRCPSEPRRRGVPGRRLHVDGRRLDQCRRRSIDLCVPEPCRATVPICLGILALVAILNLRGVGNAARAFLLPTLLFIVGLLAIIASRSRPSTRCSREPTRSVAAADKGAGDGHGPPGAEGVLCGMQRADGRGGDRKRRAASSSSRGR